MSFFPTYTDSFHSQIIYFQTSRLRDLPREKNLAQLWWLLTLFCLGANIYNLQIKGLFFGFVCLFFCFWHWLLVLPNFDFS